jgi:hypothetical protein
MCAEFNLHVAIDDTYGPHGADTSQYVTSKRRTQVGVVFKDADVDDIRRQMRDCLDGLSSIIGEGIREFHFVEIYNRKGAWALAPEGLNLKLFEFFAEIYQSYRWRVIVQTVEKRTLRDLKGLDRNLVFDGLDPTNLSDVALSLLCLKIRFRFKATNEPLTILVDEGRKKAGVAFGGELFRDWPTNFKGEYASSKTESLLQIADFFAFCVNRNTYLATKGARTDVDQWFLRLVAEMRIESDEITPAYMRSDFSTLQLDEFHRRDRMLKRIKD